MTLELLATIIAASLLGSTHCAGMCGPFVLLLMGKSETSDSSQSFRLLAYHLGRLTTYLTLGLVAGMLGHSLNKTGSYLGWQQSAAYLAGITMLATAFIMLLRQLGVPLQHLPVPAGWVKRIYSGFRVAQQWPTSIRAWWVGLLTTLIPCGWLYTFIIVAAGSADLLHGSMVMFAFWLGTIPLLSLVGVSAGQLFSHWRQASPWIAIVACLTLGWITLSHRSSFTFDSYRAGQGDVSLTTDAMPQLKTTRLPCCHDD